MTYLKRCVWAVAVTALAAGGAFAQTTTGGGTTTTGGTLGGTGTALGGGAAGGGRQQGGQGGQGGVDTSAPTIGSTSGGFNSGVVQQSNILSPYYANPSYQGVPSASSTGTTIVNPGGFGQVLFSGTGTAATGTGGRATAGRTTAGGLGGATGGLGGATAGGARTTGGLGGTTGGLGGTTSGLGGTAGRTAGGLGGTTGGLGGATGGFGGTRGTTGGIGGANSTNQQLSTGRSIAYTQTLRFGVAPLSAPQLQSDLQSSISTSSTLSSVNGLQAVVGDGNVVLLRGRVADEDEAKLVEGMILLTPGVKGVKNELQFPPPKP